MPKPEYPIIQPPKINFPQPYLHREPLIDTQLLRAAFEQRRMMNEDTEKRAEALFGVIAKDDFVPTESLYLFKNFGVLHNVNQYGRKKLEEAEDRLTDIAETVSRKGPASHFWANAEVKKLTQAVNRDISGGYYKKAENFGKMLADANSTLEKTNLEADEIYRAVNRLQTILKGFDEKNKRFDLELYERKTGSIPSLEQLAFVRPLKSPFEAAAEAAAAVHPSKIEIDQANENAKETLKEIGLDPENESYLVNVEQESRDVRNAVKEALDNHPEAVLRVILTARSMALVKELEEKMNAGLDESKKVDLIPFAEEEYIKNLQDKGRIGKAMAAIYNFHRSSKTVKGSVGSEKKRVEQPIPDYDPNELNAVSTMEEGIGLPFKNKVFLSGNSKEKFNLGMEQLSDGFNKKLVVSKLDKDLKIVSTLKTVEGMFGLQLENANNFSLTMGGIKIDDKEEMTAAKLELDALKLTKKKLSDPDLSEEKRKKTEQLFLQGIRQMNYAVEKYSEKALVVKRIAESQERSLTKSEVEFYDAMKEINDIYRNFLRDHMMYEESKIDRIAPSLK
jgi:hypothetical protein